jgi:hypothetical protein
MVGKSSAVRTFKKWLTLGLKNGRTFGLCTSWENPSRSGSFHRYLVNWHSLGYTFGNVVNGCANPSVAGLLSCARKTPLTARLRIPLMDCPNFQEERRVKTAALNAGQGEA